MTEAAGFKRLWSMPHRASGGGLLDPMTARQRYLVEQSRARYHRRPDAYAPGTEPRITGELGHIDSFRFILDEPVPDSIVPTFPQADDYGILFPMPYQRMVLGDRTGAELLEAHPFKVAPLEVKHSTAAELVLNMRAGAERLESAFDWIGRGYLAAARSGTSAMILGMDLASGPDWTAVYSWPDLVPQPVHPDWTPQDLARITAAELKRARRRVKLRRLSARGAIARA